MEVRISLNSIFINSHIWCMSIPFYLIELIVEILKTIIEMAVKGDKTYPTLD